MCKQKKYIDLNIFSVGGCEEDLNATLASQQSTITSPSGVERCSYVITSPPNTGINVIIEDGAAVSPTCGDYQLLYNPGSFLAVIGNSLRSSI